MKRKFSILVLALCALALVLCGFKGFAQTPPYTGTIDNTVKIPCAKYGKNYHITGDRLGSGSGVTKVYVDSLFNALSLAMVKDTTTTIIGDFAGVGLVTPVDTPRNTYGRIRYTNNTGGSGGSGKQIKVGYRVPYSFQAIPVVSLVASGGQAVRLIIIDPHTDSFIVELKDDISPGESIEFTYHVRAE
jgi:predicted small lipoprotein YifL